jgi:hypothetical protein
LQRKVTDESSFISESRTIEIGPGLEHVKSQTHNCNNMNNNPNFGSRLINNVNEDNIYLYDENDLYDAMKSLQVNVSSEQFLFQSYVVQSFLFFTTLMLQNQTRIYNPTSHKLLEHVRSTF